MQRQSSPNVVSPWPVVAAPLVSYSRVNEFWNDRAAARGPMIEVKNVSRSYRRNADEVRALDDVSVKIDDGCFVAFMGPSGSGKSTLLNLVSGIDRPDAG